MDQCRYEIHPRSAKEEMVRKIQELQRETDRLELGIEVAKKKNMCLGTIISSLKHEPYADEIVRRIKQSDSNQSIARWLDSLYSEQSRVGSSHIGGEVEQYSTRSSSNNGKKPGNSRTGAHGSSQVTSTGDQNRMDIESIIGVNYSMTTPYA